MDVLKIDAATVQSIGPVPAEDRHREQARRLLQQADPETAIAAALAQAEAGDVSLAVQHLNGVATRNAYPKGLRVAVHGAQLTEQLWRENADKLWSGKFGPGKGVHAL